MGNFHKDISKSFNIKGVVGMNIRRTNFTRMISATNGGLVVPEVYSLQNSAGPLPLTKELASKVGVNGIYGSVSLGFKNMIYLDGTLRGDKSSTLPTGKNVYYYPSVAASWIFSNLAPDSKWLSFGKVRVNYAVVGNSAAFDQLVDNYNIITPMNSAITSVAGTKKDPDLLPETTNSLEGGLEMYFIGRRVGFDLAGYTTNSKNQILPLAVSTATGYTYKIINAGSIKNSGVELALNATPIKVKKWKWDLTLNFAKNYNKVVSLYQGVDNLQLGSFQGGITINARVGQPYGVICGTDFVYLNGEKVVDKTTGRYLKTATSDNVIGNENPKWTGGISSQLSYGNWSLSFLVDASVGGSIFSLDMYYGLATGLYKETSYINDKGNPVRNTLADGGGYVNPGVNQDGSTNTTYEAASNYGSFGYRAFGQAVFNGTSYTTGNPDKMFVYDATFVKLRELALSYTIPSTVLKKCFLNSISISAVASNPWIIFKKLPYADPESGLGAGNLQGYTTGSLPSTRDFSLNVKFNF
jgi:outer membrane receptor protein involved in Fe transport